MRISLLLFVLAYQSAFSAEYYVATNGSDSNPGTEESPWRTVAKANATLVAGDTVYLRGGTYRRDQINPANSGAPGKPIQYRAYPGETPVIDMGTPFTQRWTKISGTDGVDAIYEAPFPYEESRFYSIVQDNTESSGRYTMWRRKDGCCDPRVGPNTVGVIEGPGQFFFSDAGIRARGAHSSNLNNSKLVGIGSTSFSNGGLILDQSHISIDGVTFQNMAFFARRTGSHTITNFTLSNSTIRHVAFSPMLMNIEEVVWRGNTFDGLGIYMADKGEVGFSTGSRRVLIEGNTFAWGGHNALYLGNRASIEHGDNANFIVRGNTFRDGGRQLLIRKVQDILIEDNDFMYSASRPESLTRLGKDNQAIKIYGSRAIVRNNRIWRHGGGGIYVLAIGAEDGEVIHANHNRIYHNTVVGGRGENWGGICLHKDIAQVNAQLTENTVVNNLVVDNTVAQIQLIGAAAKEPGNQILNNLTEAPGFVDFRAGDHWPSRDSPVDRRPDLRLVDGSPAIDTAVPLTGTVTSGEGTAVVVEDARFFTDGFGMVEGDTIVIGSNSAVNVLSVDRDLGRLVVDRVISWGAGDPVSLQYLGAAPDVGALEHRGEPEHVDVVAEAPNPPTLRVH